VSKNSHKSVKIKFQHLLCDHSHHKPARLYDFSRAKRRDVRTADASVVSPPTQIQKIFLQTRTDADQLSWQNLRRWTDANSVPCRLKIQNYNEILTLNLEVLLL